MNLNPFGFITRYWRRKTATLSTVARRSLYISLALHGTLLLSAGAIVVSHVFYNRESTFKGTPPPAKVYDPRQLEFKVKITKQARSSSRPALAPHLVSAKVGAKLTLPDIKIDSKVVKSSFQPKFRAVTGMGMGMGAGLGNGYGTGGFGAGVSSVEFFGLHARGQRIAILADVSVSMVEEEKGGPAGYARVRQRVEQVIDALSEGSLFNVIVFADSAATFEKNLVIASPENKKRAKLFYRPYNTEGNWGLSSGNLTGSSKGLQAGGGTTRLDLALTAAFEQGSDCIMIISDGLPKVRRVLTQADVQAHQQEMASWQAANAGAMQAFAASQAAAAAAPVQTVSERVWIPPTDPQPAVPPRPPSKQPPKEGQPPDRGTPGRPATAGTPGHWEVRTHTIGGGGGGGGPPRPRPPPPPEPGWWSLTDFLTHLRMLYEGIYVPKGAKPPVIHCIGYQIDEDGNAFLRDLSAAYHGNYRRVQRLR